MNVKIQSLEWFPENATAQFMLQLADKVLAKNTQPNLLSLIISTGVQIKLENIS